MKQWIRNPRHNHEEMSGVDEAVLSGEGQNLGEPISLDGFRGNCMEAPGDRSTSMDGLVKEYRSLGGGCCPVVLRNGAETVAFIDPTLEITILGREAADFLRIGRRMSPDGVVFERIQLYLWSTLSGCAQPFRVTPFHCPRRVTQLRTGLVGNTSPYSRNRTMVSHYAGQGAT